MSDEPSERIRLAWRRATDADVAEGLRSRDGVSNQVYDIIEAEARRRGITEQDLLADPNVLVAACRRTLSSAVRCLGAHPFVSGSVLGVATLLTTWLGSRTGQNLNRPEWLALIFGGPLLALGVISWPLRFYRPCLLAALAAGLAHSIIGVVWGIVAWRRFPSLHPGIGYFVVFAGGNMVGWAIRCALLCLAVRLHNQYRPIYPPGHCRGCGYHLRGLPERRCPECGRSFDPDQQVPVTDPTEAE